VTFADDPGVVRDFAVRPAESAGLPVRWPRRSGMCCAFWP
jgi:hypothetical protein